MKIYLSLIMLLLLPFGVSAQNVHPDVQTALEWQLAKHECVPPKVKPSHDSSSGNERKYKKAKKKFEKCFDAYKVDLIEQQQAMMAVAKHGVTQEQADIVLGNMKLIQSIVTSPYDAQAVQIMGAPHEDTDIQVIQH